MEDTIESRIASILWRWKFTDAIERDAMIADSKLATLLEFWFPFSEIEYTKLRGTWCDGITLMVITEIDRTTFRIAGVGYFPRELTPFELDFDFHNRRDLTPQAIILRLGNISHERHQTSGPSKHSQYILDSRPKHNSDWAVAVELTGNHNENA